jgi:hypothetical protein
MPPSRLCAGTDGPPLRRHGRSASTSTPLLRQLCPPLLYIIVHGAVFVPTLWRLPSNYQHRYKLLCSRPSRPRGSWWPCQPGESQRGGTRREEKGRRWDAGLEDWTGSAASVPTTATTMDSTTGPGQTAAGLICLTINYLPNNSYQDPK